MPLKWILKNIATKDLKEYPKNPRSLTKKGLEHLEESIKKFGVAEPLVLNTDLTICGGHGRKKVLEKLNIDFVDCYVPEKPLSKKQFEELNIRLNKNIAGEFDFDILANEFEMEDLLEWGFEENELGMDFFPGNENEDEVPEVPTEAMSKLGDLFLIDGRHRVMCGDSTKAEDVEKLMDGNKADLGLTDPPYNLNFKYNSYKDNKHRKEYQEFCSSFFTELKNNSVRQIVTCGKQNIFMWAFVQEPTDYGTWYASNKMSGGKISNLALCEPILFFGDIDRNSRANDFFEYNIKQQKDVGGHTCPKVVSFWLDLVKSYSIQSLLDLFLGSGTSLIACEQTKRICYGMEIEPVYIDVILKRYYKMYPTAEFKCLNRKFDFKKLFNEAQELKKCG